MGEEVTRRPSIARAAAGSSMIGYNAAPRRDHDFYGTADEDVTRALLQSPVGSMFGRTIWEPACGDGAMARVIESEGFDVIGTDAIDRGYGKGGESFLDTTEALAEDVMSNPPFTIWFDPETGEQLPGRPSKGVPRTEVNGQTAFLTHARKIGVKRIALFHKAQFWHAQNRIALWDFWQPAYVMPLTWRPDFTGQGAPTMDCGWTFWVEGWTGTTVYLPLKRPLCNESQSAKLTR